MATATASRGDCLIILKRNENGNIYFLLFRLPTFGGLMDDVALTKSDDIIYRRS